MESKETRIELTEGAVCRHHDAKWIRELFMPFDIKIMEHIIFTTMNGHKSNGFFLLESALEFINYVTYAAISL